MQIEWWIIINNEMSSPILNQIRFPLLSVEYVTLELTVAKGVHVLVSYLVQIKSSAVRAHDCEWLLACDDAKKAKKETRGRLALLFHSENTRKWTKATIILSNNRLCSICGMNFEPKNVHRRQAKGGMKTHRMPIGAVMLTGVQFVPILNFELDYSINLHF